MQEYKIGISKLSRTVCNTSPEGFATLSKVPP